MLPPEATSMELGYRRGCGRCCHQRQPQWNQTIGGVVVDVATRGNLNGIRLQEGLWQMLLPEAISMELDYMRGCGRCCYQRQPQCHQTIGGVVVDVATRGKPQCNQTMGGVVVDVATRGNLNAIRLYEGLWLRATCISLIQDPRLSNSPYGYLIKFYFN